MDAIEYPSLAPGVAQSGMASEAWRAPSGASHSSNTAGTTTRGVGQPDESSSEAAAFRDAAPALREDLAVDFEELFFAPAAGAVPVARTPPDSATAEAYVSASIGMAVAASSAAAWGFFSLLPMRGTTSLPPMCSRRNSSKFSFDTHCASWLEYVPSPIEPFESVVSTSAFQSQSCDGPRPREPA